MLNGSFLDILGVVIAFSVVMLILSILVTAMAQATQATFRLRARNLQRGLAAVLERELPDRKCESRQFAAVLLNSPDIAVLRRRKDPNSLFDRFRGPLVSWLDPEVLAQALWRDQGGIPKGPPVTGPEGASVELGLGLEPPSSPPAEKYKNSDPDSDSQGRQIKNGLEEPGVLPKGVDVSAIVQRFESIDAPMRKRFGAAMRAISLLWAVVVAAAFQVSTPNLLRQLTTDPELRARYVALAPGVLTYAEGATERLSVDHGDVAKAALDQLLENHPELRSQTEQVTDTTDYPEGVAEDLAEALKTIPNRASIIAELDELLKQEMEKQRDVGLIEARAVMDQLSLINVTPWRYGTVFYLHNGNVQLRNILGVLATAILLSLGAPFWFKTLKRGLALRDVLSPENERESTNRKSGDKSDQDESRGPGVT